MSGLMWPGKTVTSNPAQNPEYYVYPVSNGENLTLIPNYTQKKAVKDLVAENNCKAGINGGFYDENNLPLGWLFWGGNLVQKPRNSDLFNGSVWQDMKGKINIGYADVPKDVTWGFQTGPRLIEQGKKVSLNLESDKAARRSVLGVSTEGKVSLVSVPDIYLGELADKIASLNFWEAINLDGGRASAFWDGSNLVPELEPVGSFICLK